MAILVFLAFGCSDNGSNGGTGGTGGTAEASYAANLCVGDKQAAAAAFCRSTFEAWAAWDGDQDDSARDAALASIRTDLGSAWDAAESSAEAQSANCSDLALTSSEAGTEIESLVASIKDTINDGLDLGQTEQAQCGMALLQAAGTTCEQALVAQGAYIADLAADPDGATLEAAKMAAANAFFSTWADATSGTCPTTATDERVGADVGSLVDRIVLDTTVTPGLDDQAFTALEPGPTEYLGRTYEPQCMQGDQYRYFAKRGTVNKLLIYYEGGGACWNHSSCSAPTCTTEPVTRIEDVYAGTFHSGFADLTNPSNPFRDWNIVFVSYCSCDLNFGDASRTYTAAGQDDITVEHRGFHNSKVAEKWAREHFLNPEVVFVTGSSAGAYSAWFNAPLLHEVWPASQFDVLADAGNGVITQEFLQNEFGNWNFVANLPDIPGVLEALNTGGGITAYTEAVATYFGDTNWAHYATLYDGAAGGQTGFYNIMLYDGNPLGALTWWDATCQFGQKVLQQSEDTYAAVSSNTDNYRYYFGTGSRHIMWSYNKVYDDTTGGVPTVVDWVNAMLASGPGGRDPDWTNVLCNNCGVLLDGDPRPNPLEPPFEQEGQDVVVVCE